MAGSQPGFVVLLPISIPPVTTFVPKRPLLSWQVVVLTDNPRVAQLVPPVPSGFAVETPVTGRILGFVNPDPGTAKILAPRLPEGRLPTHWEVSSQLDCRDTFPASLRCSKEKNANTLFFQIGPPRLPR